MSIQTGLIRVTQEARGRVPGDGVELSFGYWPGRRAPVVALHGITANFMNFIGLAERLAGRCPLFAPDFRGRGDSDKPEGPYGFAQHARDVAAAMRAMQIGPAIVVGHSMGGFVAMALATQDPELVSALVLVDGGFLIDPAAIGSGNSVNAALAERINQLTRTYDSRQAYKDFWKTKPNFPPSDWGPWVEAFLDNEVAGEGPVQPKALQAAVIADLMEGPKTGEIVGRCRAVRVPVILLRAETGFTPAQPPLYPDSVMDDMRRCTPQLDDRKIGGATHYTILLGDHGATEVADTVAQVASRTAHELK